MNFALQADLQTGGEVGIDVKVLNFSVNPYAGISSWGGVEYSDVEKRIKGKIGVGKPYVGLKGELKLGGYNIIPSGDIKKIWEDIKIEEEFKISTNESRN